MNRDILDKIAEFEEQQFAGTKRDTDFQAVLKHVKLGPMNETGGTTLLHMVKWSILMITTCISP